MSPLLPMKRFVLAALFLIVVVILVGPLIVPIPPLPTTGPDAIAPITELADADSLFIEINGQQVHYKRQGEGEPIFLLLHGFASSTFTWRHLLPVLAKQGTAIALDRPGFGLSERPLAGAWEGENPYSPEAQADLNIQLLDALGFDQAILIGNSAGGTVAVHTYLRHPQRVQSLILLDPAIYSGGGAPGWVKPLLRTPQARRLGPYLARSFLGSNANLLDLAWHDPSRVTPDVITGYRQALRVPDWDKALWEFTLASRDLQLDQQLDQVLLPTLVLTGDDDRIVPTAQSVRLAEELPNARLVVIPDCGHVPQEECPEATIEAITIFLQTR